MSRTELQRHSNAMLSMRRMLGYIAICGRLEYSVFGRGYWRLPHG